MTLHYFHWMLFLVFIYFVPPFPRFHSLFATLSKISFTLCPNFQGFIYFVPHSFTFCHLFQDFIHFVPYFTRFHYFVPHFPRLRLLCATLCKVSFTLCRLLLLSKLTFLFHLRCYSKATLSNSIFSSFQDYILLCYLPMKCCATFLSFLR
jgi:hypothetical protein